MTKDNIENKDITTYINKELHNELNQHKEITTERNATHKLITTTIHK